MNNKTIYVKDIEIVSQNYPGSHVLDIGMKIECSDINLLVGDQGCGKSTLLKLLRDNNKSDIKINLREDVIKRGISTFYFDTESMNPRVTDPQMYTTPNGENTGIGFGAGLMSRFKSHGEVMKEFILTPLDKAKDCVIFLDEPESGLSINNQLKMIKVIKKAIKNNCQLFIATHCYPLIQTFDVYSLEHKSWMKGKDFLKLVGK